MSFFNIDGLYIGPKKGVWTRHGYLMSYLAHGAGMPKVEQEHEN